MRSRLASAVPLTQLGRWVLATALVAVLVGLEFGWDELSRAGFTLAAVLLAALPWTLGQGPAHIGLSVAPVRVTAGESANARVTASGRARGTVRGLRIEVPVNGAIFAVDMPAVEPGRVTHQEVALPTEARGVLDVGPARAVRADPLGLTRRTVATGGTERCYVWPRVVTVPSLGSGLLRDLEGRTTSEPSPSDAAFHTLREYVPGDDRRHVHWRTSARTGRLMVRQFVDIRLSRLTLLMCDRADEFDAADFELGVSVLGSLALRAQADRLSVTLRVGADLLAGSGRTSALDALAGVRLARPEDDADAGRTARPGSAELLRLLGPAASGDVVIVVGPHTPLRDLAAAAAWCPGAVVTVLRAATGTTSRAAKTTGLPVRDLGTLGDLPRVLHSAGAMR